jgi:hypothetical protein
MVIKIMIRNAMDVVGVGVIFQNAVMVLHG